MPQDKNPMRHQYKVALEDKFEHLDDFEIYGIRSICRSGNTTEVQSLQSGNRDTFSLHHIVPWILDHIGFGGSGSE
jgi:hypothetical protein